MKEMMREKRDPLLIFHGLKVWQKARILARHIYTTTQNFPPEEERGLTAQLRGTVISLVSTLAGGSAKRSAREFVKHINQAFGYLAELDAQTIIAGDLQYISAVQVKYIEEMISEIGRMLKSFQNGLNKTIKAEIIEQ